MSRLLEFEVLYELRPFPQGLCGHLHDTARAAATALFSANTPDEFERLHDGSAQARVFRKTIVHLVHKIRVYLRESLALQRHFSGVYFVEDTCSNTRGNWNSWAAARCPFARSSEF